jgi:hypothetical protein
LILHLIIIFFFFLYYPGCCNYYHHHHYHPCFTFSSILYITTSTIQLIWHSTVPQTYTYPQLYHHPPSTHTTKSLLWVSSLSTPIGACELPSAIIDTRCCSSTSVCACRRLSVRVGPRRSATPVSARPRM